MSNLSESFLAFLQKKRGETGKNRFTCVDYMTFDDYETAINELLADGLIEKTNDIVDTIILPENQ